MQPEIRDDQVFDINSPWYPLLVKLFKELSKKGCVEGHKHHWIPCSIVAVLLSPSTRQADYRAFADKAYPQSLVRMPVSAHILVHYLTWQAVHVRFKSMMQHAFEGLWGMNPPSDKYTRMLDTYMAEGPIVKEKTIKHRKEKSKQGSGLGREWDRCEVPYPSQFLDTGAAVKECACLYKEYKGKLSWPKFQHKFMSRFQERTPCAVARRKRAERRRFLSRSHS